MRISVCSSQAWWSKVTYYVVTCVYQSVDVRSVRICQLWLYCIDMSVLSLVLHHSTVSESWNETELLHNTSISYASHEDSVWLLYYWYFLSDYHRQQYFVFLWELRALKMWMGKGAVTVPLHASFSRTHIHDCHILPPSTCAAVLVFSMFLFLYMEWETV